MPFSCQVCKALSPTTRGLRIRAADLSNECHTCNLLRAAITAVLGLRFWNIITRIEILSTVGEDGPLRVDVVHDGNFPKVNLQFYRAAGRLMLVPRSSSLGTVANLFNYQRLRVSLAVGGYRLQCRILWDVK